eukprot:10752431-Alexandrium_andersonii.AAC.1
MKKRELVDELPSYELDTRPEWTLAKLRELVKMERDARGTYRPKAKQDWGKMKLLGLQEACAQKGIR